MLKSSSMLMDNTLDHVKDQCRPYTSLGSSGPHHANDTDALNKRPHERTLARRLLPIVSVCHEYVKQIWKVREASAALSAACIYVSRAVPCHRPDNTEVQARPFSTSVSSVDVQGEYKRAT